MPVIPETIKTDVDVLIELIRQKGEISFEDAASQTHLPLSTIEAWANFLEEEGLISIKYKFTTPYLVYHTLSAEDLKKRTGEAKKKDPEELMDEVQNLLKKAYSSTSSKELTTAEKSFSEIHSSLKNLSASLPTEGKKDMFFKKGLDGKIKQAELLLKESSDQLKRNSLEDARKTYLQIYALLKDIHQSLKDYREEAKSAEKRYIVKEELVGLEHLFKKAYDYIKRGKFDLAREIYRQIEERYTGLPSEFIERKDSIKKDLIKLNRDMSLHLGETTQKVIAEKSKILNRLIRESHNYLAKGDIVNAIRAYNEIERIYFNLPEGFLSEKTHLQKKILNLQEKIIVKKEDIYLGDFKSKSKTISGKLFRIKKLVRKRAMAEAVKEYGNMRRVFATLPTGFLEEKTELQNRILTTYRELLLYKTKISSESLRANSLKINELLVHIQEMVKRNEIERANRVYDAIISMYQKLPPGFLVEKTKLQERILKVSESIAVKLDELSSRSFTEKTRDIEKLNKLLQDYLKKKEFDLAHVVYEEIVGLYNHLPAGFMEKKTKLRNEVLNLYREILLGSDSLLLEGSSNITKREYNELLRMIVRFKEHVGQKQFHLLESDYEHIKQLYEKMPIGLIRKNTKIKNEMRLIRDKIRLYKLATGLKTITEKRDLAGLKNELERIFAVYNDLTKESGEDVELFNFIHTLYSKYLRIYEESDEAIARKTQEKPPEKMPEKAVEKKIPEEKEKETAGIIGIAEGKTRQQLLDHLKEKVKTAEKRLSKIDLEYVEPIEPIRSLGIPTIPA